MGQAHSAGRRKAPILRGPALLAGKPSSEQGDRVHALRRKLIECAGDAVDGYAALYVDIDGSTRIGRGRPADEPPSLVALRVGVYGIWVQGAQLFADIDQHWADLGCVAL